MAIEAAVSIGSGVLAGSLSLGSGEARAGPES